MKELRLQSGQPESNFRLILAVDGVNALWGRSTIKKEDKSAVRKHILNLFMLYTCLDASHLLLIQFPQIGILMCLFFLTIIRLIWMNLLWFITWGSWWRTIGWEEDTNSVEHSCLRIEFFPLRFTFLSQTGGAIITTLSQTGSLYTSKSAYLPQELLGEVSHHFYHTSLYVALALKLWQQISLSFYLLPFVISQEIADLTSRLHHSSL